MSLFAVIKTGGKQYKVSEGAILSVEKLDETQRFFDKNQDGQAQDKISFNEILLLADGEDVKVGRPFVEGAKVEARILEDGKGKKKMVFRYKSKTRRHKKKGHRQPYSKIQITKIIPG